jgi:hypothetical protein
MMRFLFGLTAMVAVIAAGIVHGVWTDRWGTPLEAATLVARLDRVSLLLGEWKGQDVDHDPEQLGPVAGSLYRRYVNRRTSAVVTVFMVCGRPGPVAIHTPDVCYRAGGYEMFSLEKCSLSPATASGKFYTCVLRKTRSSEQHQLRIFWSWYAGGTWRVPNNPRLAFARYGVLCKLYVLREVAGSTEPLDQDPCLDLMSQLLPELQKSIFSSSF